jgi:hypothetical protein
MAMLAAMCTADAFLRRNRLPAVSCCHFYAWMTVLSYLVPAASKEPAGEPRRADKVRNLVHTDPLASPAR